MSQGGMVMSQGGMVGDVISGYGDVTRGYDGCYKGVWRMICHKGILHHFQHSFHQNVSFFVLFVTSLSMLVPMLFALMTCMIDNILVACLYTV